MPKRPTLVLILLLPSLVRAESDSPVQWSFESRARYEVLDGQFRTAGTGGDQVAAFRTLIAAEADFDPVRFVAEMMDAREALADPGSALNTTTVNTLALLQAHLKWDVATGHQVRAGRMTLDLGSRRLIARNAYRNTINAFTGIDWTWTPDNRPFSFEAFYLLPIRRLPGDLPSLLVNQTQFDQESFRQQFWGASLGITGLPFGSALDLYTLGLHEDAGWLLSRQILTSGFRWHREPCAGTFDFDLESALQWGRSRLTTAGPDLNHRASFAHASLGYTFDARWKPRLRLAIDHATGDSNPTDGRNTRFDTLFGARRFEFGPTGIYGAIARSNLISPEVRLTASPAKSLSFTMAHRGIWLESAKDAWTAAGVTDPTGNSGRHVGQQVEASLRWTALPGHLEFEAGFVHLFAGRFLDRAPNASGQGDTTYGYIQTTLRF